MGEFSHLDETGKAKMVDVSDKAATARVAVAKGRVFMASETLRKIMGGDIPKGDVLATARLAGIMAAKKTADLIPLCHSLALTNVSVTLAPVAEATAIEITAEARTVDRTGVEMEAMTAVCVAALTLYDMSKAVDKRMRIGDIRLVEKSGGRSGSFREIENDS